METARQATVRLVEEKEATGRTAEIFADIRAVKNLDFVPNFRRAPASNPTLLDVV